jgi:hypothetical protein
MLARLSWPRKSNLSTSLEAFGTIASVQQKRFIFLHEAQLVAKSFDLNKTDLLQTQHDDGAGVPQMG